MSVLQNYIKRILGLIHQNKFIAWSRIYENDESGYTGILLHLSYNIHIILCILPTIIIPKGNVLKALTWLSTEEYELNLMNSGVLLKNSSESS